MCHGKALLQAWLLPDLNTIPNNWLERILLSSEVMVLAFRPGVPGSNPVQALYFCHAFIHLFPRYRLCSEDMARVKGFFSNRQQGKNYFFLYPLIYQCRGMKTYRK